MHQDQPNRKKEAHLVPQRSPRQYELRSAISSPLRLLYAKSRIRGREDCPVCPGRLSRGSEGRPGWKVAGRMGVDEMRRGDARNVIVNQMQLMKDRSC